MDGASLFLEGTGAVPAAKAPWFFPFQDDAHRPAERSGFNIVAFPSRLGSTGTIELVESDNES